VAFVLSVTIGGIFAGTYFAYHHLSRQRGRAPPPPSPPSPPQQHLEQQQQQQPYDDNSEKNGPGDLRPQ